MLPGRARARRDAPVQLQPTLGVERDVIEVDIGRAAARSKTHRAVRAGIVNPCTNGESLEFPGLGKPLSARPFMIDSGHCPMNRRSHLAPPQTGTTLSARAARRRSRASREPLLLLLAASLAACGGKSAHGSDPGVTAGTGGASAGRGGSGAPSGAGAAGIANGGYGGQRAGAAGESATEADGGASGEDAGGSAGAAGDILGAGAGGATPGGSTGANAGTGGAAHGGSAGAGGTPDANGGAGGAIQGGSAGQAGASSKRDHCIDGYVPDPSDATMLDGPVEYTKSNQVDLTVQPEVWLGSKRESGNRRTFNGTTSGVVLLARRRPTHKAVA